MLIICTGAGACVNCLRRLGPAAPDPDCLSPSAVSSSTPADGDYGDCKLIEERATNGGKLPLAGLRWDMFRTASAVFFLALAACSTATADISLPALAVQNTTSELKDGQTIELDAWVKNSGEIMLFDSRKAMKLGLAYPYCISAGLNPKLNNPKMTEIAGKSVRIKGTLLRYESPQQETNTISTSTLIGGMFFKNWCVGPFVVRIEELTIRKREWPNMGVGSMDRRNTSFW